MPKLRFDQISWHTLKKPGGQSFYLFVYFRLFLNNYSPNVTKGYCRGLTKALFQNEQKADKYK